MKNVLDLKENSSFSILVDVDFNKIWPKKLQPLVISLSLNSWTRLIITSATGGGAREAMSISK